MESSTKADKIIADIHSRDVFIDSQQKQGFDVMRLQAAQVTKIVTMIAKAKTLDPADAKRVTDTVQKGSWTPDQKSSMQVAVGNILSMGDDLPDAHRCQQDCDHPEGLLSVGDVENLERNKGNEQMVTHVVGSRAWLAGCTCPSETLKKRLGAICTVLGGLNPSGNALEATKIQNKVRQVIKRIDGKRKHPLAHTDTVSSDPSRFDAAHFTFCGYDTDPPTSIDDVTTATIDSLMSAGVRETHGSVRNAIVVTRGSSSGLRRQQTAPIQLDGNGNVQPSGADVLQGLMQPLQQMFQMQAMMFNHMMGGSAGAMGGHGFAGAGGAVESAGASSSGVHGNPALMQFARPMAIPPKFGCMPPLGASPTRPPVVPPLQSPATPVGAACAHSPGSDGTPPPQLALQGLQHGGASPHDEGIARLSLLEAAQLAVAKGKTAPKAKSHAKAGRAGGALDAKPAWDVGDDEAEPAAAEPKGDGSDVGGSEGAESEVPEEEVTDAEEPVVARRPAAAAALKAASKPGKSASGAAPAKPPAKGAVPASKTAGKGKALAKATPAVKPKAKPTAATKAKGLSPLEPDPDDPNPDKPRLFGVSFADLIDPNDIKKGQSRGAWTSRAYDTTRKRGREKFGKFDERADKVAKKAYRFAGTVYDKHA